MSSRPPKRPNPSTPLPDGSYFPIRKITELAALTRSITVHMIAFEIAEFDFGSRVEQSKVKHRKHQASSAVTHTSAFTAILVNLPPSFEAVGGRRGRRSGNTNQITEKGYINHLNQLPVVFIHIVHMRE